MRRYRILKIYITLIGVSSLLLIVNIYTLNTFKVSEDQKLYHNLRIVNNTSGVVQGLTHVHSSTLTFRNANDTLEGKHIKVQDAVKKDVLVNYKAEAKKQANERRRVNINAKKEFDIHAVRYKFDNPKSFEMKEFPVIPIASLNMSKYISKSPLEDERRTMLFFRIAAKVDSGFLVKILNQTYLHPETKEMYSRYFMGSEVSVESTFKNKITDSNKEEFDINKDVMVFLHIQKSGGMYLNKRLGDELDTPFRCNCTKKGKPCKCLNSNGNAWVYASYSLGWPCGLHADWTQLHRCIPGQLDAIEGKIRQRRYFYFTQLRDPLDRYTSEFHHQSVKGMHWQDALLGCGNGFPDWSDIRPCFHTESWKGVSLDEFMACPHNLATNRMTRMLADLNIGDCYRHYQNRTLMLERAITWLKSAKENLQQMEYFGFLEDLDASDMLFSAVFKMNFERPGYYKRKRSILRLTEKQFLKILQLVELDVHLYLFAKDLFEQRLRNL